MLSFNRDEYDLSGNGKDQQSVFEPDKERLLKLVNTLVNRINSLEDELSVHKTRIKEHSCQLRKIKQTLVINKMKECHDDDE